jgi:hypothetical protein
VHWIQAKLSFGRRHRTGRLAAVDRDILSVEYRDKVSQYRNCDPDRLLDIVGIGGDVSVCERYSILRTDSEQGHYLFCIADAEKPWVPCDYMPLTAASPDELAARLQTHGGFMLTAQEVMKAFRDR